MNILFLTSRLPYPPIGGDKLRVLNLLQNLVNLGYNITLISLYDNKTDLKYTYENNSFFHKLIPVKFYKNLSYVKAAKSIFDNIPFTVRYFYSHEMQKAVDAELKNTKYDLIFCHLIRTAKYVQNYSNILKVIDLTDAISLSYKRRIDLSLTHFDKFKIKNEYKRVLAYETSIIKDFDKSFLISAYDKDYLSQNISVDKVEILPNGVDNEYFYCKNERYDNQNIVFIGNMRTVANNDAAMYFGQEIFPIIKQSLPNATFTIIGAYPKKNLYQLVKKVPGIIITGQVDDVRPYMEKAAVSVCPVRIAAGMQNKILESMSMGIPVVTTRQGFEGIYANQDEIIVTDKPEEFANAVISLIKDPNLRKSFSNNSRKFILNKFSWPNIISKLDNSLRKLTNTDLAQIN